MRFDSFTSNFSGGKIILEFSLAETFQLLTCLILRPSKQTVSERESRNLYGALTLTVPIVTTVRRGITWYLALVLSILQTFPCLTKVVGG